MKTLLLSFAFLFSVNAFTQDRPDKYAEYLAAIQKEMDRYGIQVNVNNPNPFITGSALQNYFMNEKILLLERDAYFMMKSNKLETTEEVADYQHRLKVLISHSNNILLSMVRALKNAKQEGFTQIEQPKHQLQWEELLEQCKKDPTCVSRRLESGEVILQNDIVDTFELSLQVFKQIPYMHAIEFASMFQLVQLLQLEAVVGHSRVSVVEFDLFLKKQKKMIRDMEDNRMLTSAERDYHRTVINNTANKWKKKILERKFDQKEKFISLKDKLRKENQELIGELEVIRKKNPGIMPEAEICRKFLAFKKDRRKCLLREKLEDNIVGISKNKNKFIGTKEKKLPEDFFNTL